MITALRNQPLAFAADRHQGPAPFDPVAPLLLRQADGLVFQVGATRSVTAAGQLAAPTFGDATQWSGGTAWAFLVSSAACYTGTGSPATPLVEQSFTPTPGAAYEVEVIVGALTSPSRADGVTFTLGGVSFTAYTAGTYFFQVDAITAQAFTITPALNGTTCITFAQVYPANRNIVVRVKDEDTTTVATLTPAADPGAFTFTPYSATVEVDLVGEAIAAGCYYVEVEDTVDSVVLTSGPITVGAFPDALLLRATNTEDAAGLYFAGANFAPRMRVHGNLGRSTHSLDREEVRSSAGRLDYPFGDRVRTMRLSIQRLSEAQHDALAAWALFDAFYIGPDAYAITSKELEPDFADVYEHTAGITLEVQPKEELARKVRTAAEATSAAPPPNYLVLDQGPSVESPVLLTETAQPIELAE